MTNKILIMPSTYFVGICNTSMVSFWWMDRSDSHCRTFTSGHWTNDWKYPDSKIAVVQSSVYTLYMYLLICLICFWSEEVMSITSYSIGRVSWQNAISEKLRRFFFSLSLYFYNLLLHLRSAFLISVTKHKMFMLGIVEMYCFKF